MNVTIGIYKSDQCYCCWSPVNYLVSVNYLIFKHLGTLVPKIYLNLKSIILLLFSFQDYGRSPKTAFCHQMPYGSVMYQWARRNSRVSCQRLVHYRGYRNLTPIIPSEPQVPHYCPKICLDLPKSWL